MKVVLGFLLNSIEIKIYNYINIKLALTASQSK